MMLESNPMKTILAFGDSLTWGFEAASMRRHAFEDRWPNVLQAKLGTEYRVIAEGLNGRTTVHDDNLVDELRNGAKALPMLLSTHQPLDLVIIALGTNDLKHPWWSRASDAKRGVQRLVELTQRFPYAVGMRAPKIAVIAPPAVVHTDNNDFDKIFSHGIKESQKFGDEYKLLEATHNVEVFEAAKVVEADPRDGIHLDAANTRKLGEALAPLVRQMLED
jgi:lysophospholipase L1-like esterase